MCELSHFRAETTPFCPSVANGGLKMAKAVKKAHKKGLDGRAEERGKISRKHGNTRIDTLRKTYGEHFAAGRRGDMHLATLLKETGSESLHEYLRHHHKD
jgi:hypothetical protein